MKRVINFSVILKGKCSPRFNLEMAHTSTSKKILNYPNPFNPETWIPYQLAADSPVIISIYNSKGQLIRSLNLGNRNVGIYLTKDKAAYWDSKDETGEKVASGVYFYTLQVEHQRNPGLIDVPEVKRGIIQAQNASNFGGAERHEEGGFILKDKNGNLSTQAWSAGETDRLIPPSHPDGRVGDKEIVGSYHTHPNTGSDYRQEPSQADINWVVNNPKNAGNKHFVISEKKIYKIDIQGNVTVVGRTKKVLKLK